jgi:hypothetical protein
LNFDCEIGKDTWNLVLEQAGFDSGRCFNHFLPIFRSNTISNISNLRGFHPKSCRSSLPILGRAPSRPEISTPTEAFN